jgi:hypothetical protein
VTTITVNSAAATNGSGASSPLASGSRGFAPAAVWKVGIVALILTASWLGLIPSSPPDSRGMLWWPRDAEPTRVSHLATYDAAYYLYLGEAGYARGVRACAFYPLWPLLMRWASPLAGGNHLIAGLVLANLFSLAAWVLFHQRVRRRWGSRVAGWSLAFLVAYPGALFFQFPYTESLFLLLVMVLWWGLEERRWGLVWVAGLLLPMTRAIGVFAVLPIAWYAARESGLRERVGEWGRRKWGRRKAPGGTDLTDGAAAAGSGLPAGPRCVPTGAAPTQRRPTGPAEDGAARRGFPWLLLAAPLVGWGLYLALMWLWTGNPFEGFVAQKTWGVHFISNLWNVPNFVWVFFQPTQWHEFRGSLLDRAVFVVLLYTVPVLWRLDKGLLVWTYWLGVLPAMSGTFTSYTRFASCAFPVFLALAAYFNAGRLREVGESPAVLAPSTPPSAWRRAGQWGLFAEFVVLHVVLVWRHVNFNWAG